MTQTDWLTREDIDTILDQMSAADVIEAIGDGSNAGAKVAGLAFDAAAARLSYTNGTRASERVKASDFGYLGTKLGEVVSLDGPLPEKPESSRSSADSGE